MEPTKHQNVAGSSRSEPPAPIFTSTAASSKPESRDDQHYYPPSNREVPSSEAPSGEAERDHHRSITEFVASGTVAPTHFGTRRRRLLHPASHPALAPSSDNFPLSSSHLAREETPVSFAVHRPGPRRTPIERRVRRQGLEQPHQLELPRSSFESHRSAGRFAADVGSHPEERRSQDQVRNLNQEQSVPDLVRSASPGSRVGARSLSVGLTLPTELELLVASENSQPPPPIPPRAASRPNPYPSSTPAVPPRSLVRRRAVSYRSNPPGIASASRQGAHRVITTPVRPLESLPESPQRHHSRPSGSDNSFRKENSSSSPLARQVTPARKPQNPVTPEARSLGTAGTGSSGTTSFSSTNNEAGYLLQGQGPSRAEHSAAESFGAVGDFSAGPHVRGISGSTASPDCGTPSSSPLADFDFGFEREEDERVSGQGRSGRVPPPNTPAPAHPNFANFKFSFASLESAPQEAPEETRSSEPAPAHPNFANFKFSFASLESGPQEASEETGSTKPSLPELPPAGIGRGPRGLASAIAEKCRKFEVESPPARAKQTSTQSQVRAVSDDAGPRLRLSPSSRISSGLPKTGTEESALSEIAKGQRPEQRSPMPNRSDSSEDMDFLHPESAAAMTEHRREAVRMAKSQEAAVVEKCKRSGAAAPPYTFDELIGKGSFGRVYKGRQTSSNKVVAIKVIDVDDTDFRAFGDAKDEQINDFNKEIRILRQAQESGAPNLNQMIEALPVHSQLWLVCEHCPGGSVKTLMRATNDKLGEKYITVVARELSKALKGLHDAGIMHRDIKAANVLIHEEGSLQLCDFGVATVLDKKTDKRRTFIGTLHWMPPELWDKDPEYSDEVTTRPSFSDVLAHEYLANTEETHPTRILSELVKVYYSWLYGGGQRASLFMPGGAAAASAPESLTTSDEEWNFSATDNFKKRMSSVLNIPDFSDLSEMQSMEGDSTPKAPRAAATGELSSEEQANFEERVRRGADLSNIFDPNKPNYEYVTKKDFVPIQQRRVSDLPLRAMSEERPYSIANQVIDLGEYDSSNYASVSQTKDEKIKLADAATIKANRGNSKLYLDVPTSETSTTKPTMSANKGLSAANISADALLKEGKGAYFVKEY
ncbi:hypothetical protein EPUS_03950 [Endocarpon pusillum Z07020]|uniref:non-specific serine/threonine protein kinase n=1 Tax=Endocarpon pusillum (strain Z07020 / HMAS-L-300199) TaxID=1263415 RepID=U1GAG8_ENDPU|nr:uncharacterized protein EPUS_03950 [Endocarpon pusillum Z07020]ERF74512.1 hypothetical protein EPUS_03950 [Endocarpon pusillum Z07020]